jgi:predicted metal-binding membrane protein
MTHWMNGMIGAFRMGMHHGAYCLGCCWALMCVLFVVGVMNLFWVAALTAFVLVEKLGPAGAVVARIAGVGLVVGGIKTIA